MEKTQRRASAEGQQNEDENTDEEDARMARLERRMRDRRNRRRNWFLDHHGTVLTMLRYVLCLYEVSAKNSKWRWS